MTTGSTDDLIERFFAALESGDRSTLADLYADDIQIWHSATGRTVDGSTGLAILDWLMAPGVKIRYELVEQLSVDDRTSRRHILEVGVPGHPPLRIPASIYLTVSGGQIQKIDEYVDSKLTDELIAHPPVALPTGPRLEVRVARGRAKRGMPSHRGA